jgi:hypothetical protein
MSDSFILCFLCNHFSLRQLPFCLPDVAVFRHCGSIGILPQCPAITVSLVIALPSTAKGSMGYPFTIQSRMIKSQSFSSPATVQRPRSLKWRMCNCPDSTSSGLARAIPPLFVESAPNERRWRRIGHRARGEKRGQSVCSRIRGHSPRCQMMLLPPFTSSEIAMAEFICVS